jgi:opacity protein-like surface antigen
MFAKKITAMKKIILVFIAALGFVTANAQNKGNIEFGFGAGLNRSTVSNNDGDYADSNTSFNLGASADYYFSDRWSIKAKLFYDRKGWDNGTITNLDNGMTYTTNYNLDYLTVPVMANWHFGRQRNWYLNFGPYAGFLLSAKETSFDLDFKDNFKSTDFGLGLGIGVKIPVSEFIKIYIEYDGQVGFSDIFDGQGDDNYTTSRDAFNVGINFML